MEDCLFTKIIKKELPAKIVFENEDVLAFEDISPQAKIHLLFIHKQKKTKNIDEMVTLEPQQITHIMQAITEYARKEGLDRTGYRIVNNLGDHGGQTVYYTHFHLLAGETLRGFGAR
jgi:histidine triad (HIT) family protein